MESEMVKISAWVYVKRSRMNGIRGLLASGCVAGGILVVYSICCSEWVQALLFFGASFFFLVLFAADKKRTKKREIEVTLLSGKNGIALLVPEYGSTTADPRYEEYRIDSRYPATIRYDRHRHALILCGYGEMAVIRSGKEVRTAPLQNGRLLLPMSAMTYVKIRPYIDFAVEIGEEEAVL